MNTDYVCVTEIAGDEVSQEQVDRLCNRYYWAGTHCSGKEVLEVACGAGQGLGYLKSIAKNFQAGDISQSLLGFARRNCKDRIPLLRFDTQWMPFENQSKDVIIIFEAIYYIPDAEKFVRECVRVLRPGGKVLIATANKDLYDFNPSPFSHKYYGVTELNILFSKYGFKKIEFFGYISIYEITLRQKILRPIKKLAVLLNLIPKTTSGKKFLKRLVFGELRKMPSEIDSNTSEYVAPDRISSKQPDKIHKVIYCIATLG